MRTSMLRNRGSTTGPLFIVMVVFAVLWGGCAAKEPVPVPDYYGSSFNRVWDSALGAAGDAGVKITSADRTTGIIRGVTNSSDVTISVITQADGRIKVEFSRQGPQGQDADLNDRFTRFFNRRMGS